MTDAFLLSLGQRVPPGLAFIRQFYIPRHTSVWHEHHYGSEIILRLTGASPCNTFPHLPPMPSPIVGLHHVTAFVSDPQQNLDFYTESLGLRFVKRTVNFDDPGTYHFYFGDDLASPGTIMTTFPWPHAARGKRGAGETTHIAFSIPVTSLDFWRDHLGSLGLEPAPSARFQEQVLTIEDPDGLQIELVAHTDVASTTRPSRFSDIPAQHAINGFFGVTLLERDAAATISTLNLMGFHQVAAESNRLRFSAAGNSLGNHIDLLLDSAAPRGRMGAGIVHHIAFRAPNDAAQLEWRALIERHLDVTTVQNRDYFHSIYFREPGGVLFELATDNPGFTFDEPLGHLGERLCLPEWLEPRRKELESRLLPITIPARILA